MAGQPITAEEADRFRRSLAQRRISHPLAHASYLINLASPNEALWRKSVDSLATELRRAEILDIPYVVVHPGWPPASASRPAWPASSGRSTRSMPGRRAFG